MNKSVYFFAAILLGLAVSLASVVAAEVKQGEMAVPVITQSFASNELIPGYTWKVYLKAIDPNGDMRYIVSNVYQPGWGDYPISRTKIREANRKELDGYIYLNTLVPGGYEFLNFFTVTLTVQIQDKAGQYSKPVVIPVSFNKRAVPELPPPGVFKEEDLGPILVNLHPFDYGRP